MKVSASILSRELGIQYGWKRAGERDWYRQTSLKSKVIFTKKKKAWEAFIPDLYLDSACFFYDHR